MIFFVLPYLSGSKADNTPAVLKIRRGSRDNLGIIFDITPLKYML